MAINEIKSKLPGVFYRKPSPEEPEYKQEGDTVNKGDIIGLVEVMKSFHEVISDYSGTLKSFNIGNEDTVTPGATIAEIDSG